MDIHPPTSDFIVGDQPFVPHFDLHSSGMPSEPILGLPVRRFIPQDAHTLLDWAGALANAVCAVLADRPSTKVSAALLGSSGMGVSMCTDYRLSAAKLIPIEVHEVIDYAWGAANVALPFVLGYWKRDPLVASLQIGTGLLTIVGSLFTDYRAWRGVRWSGKRIREF